jgi:hypothetical protein
MQRRDEEKLMTGKLLAACALAGAVTLGACASMDDTTRRTTTGAAVGGAAAGLISGEWGWAAAGAAAGAVGGYLYDQHKQSEEKAYQKGVREGKSK